MTPAGRRPLVLDLDGTLLHTEAASGVEVPGRTRSSYLATGTIVGLARLASTMDVVIATARSWAGTEPVVSGLTAGGVPISGVITEDGAMLGTAGALKPFTDAHDWPALRADFAGGPVPFTWQDDFEACLVGRAAERDSAVRLADHWRAVARGRDSLRVFQDGRKVYLTDMHATKWEALRALLGPRADQAAGVGDGLNDVCWLSRVALPCSFGTARPEVAGLVTASGIWVPEDGHRGIGLVLERLAATSGAP